MQVKKASGLAAAALLLAGCAASGSREAPAAGDFGYPSVAAALRELRARPDAECGDERGWVVCSQPEARVLWSFTPADHPAHPAGVRREVVEKDGAIHLQMAVLCEAEQAACDRLVEDFEQLNERLRREFSARGAEARGMGLEDEARMCAAVGCRRNVTIRLQREDGGVFHRRYPVFPPPVQEGSIMILPGETLFVEAEVQGDRLVGLRAVERVTAPEKTLVARFEQLEDGAMLLSLQNPFRRHLKFHMAFMPLDQDRMFKTSSCPVVPGGSAFEHWPFPIFQLLLFQPRLLEQDAAGVCEF